MTDGAPRYAGWKQALVTLALILGVGYLVWRQVVPGAPLRGWLSEPPQQLADEATFTKFESDCCKVSGGRNLALHIAQVNLDDPSQDLLASEIYFSAVYALYPRHVLVGRGGQIISSTQQLKRLDTLPDDAWLAQHDVGGVMTARLIGNNQATFEGRSVGGR